MNFDGQVALVTGAASGIGAAVAMSLRARGARVAGIDLQHAPECDLAIEADVGDADALGAAISEAAAGLGPPTLACHAAGIARDAVHWKLPIADWDAVLRVNLTAAFHLLRGVTPHIRAEGLGSVVLIGSINGDRGKFGQTAYAASKAGLVGLAKSAARELGRFGGRVNVVAPGMVDTPMTRSLPDEWREKARAESVLGRVATAADVAACVRFLLSADARHVTGQALAVDGGQNM